MPQDQATSNEISRDKLVVGVMPDKILERIELDLSQADSRNLLTLSQP